MVTVATTSLTATAQRQKWWQSEELKAHLELTAQQVAEIEQIYQATLPRLRSLDKELRALESQLSKMIDEMNVTEWEVTLQIDKVEASRSALGKARTLMLYQMHKVMTPQQRDTFHDWGERHRKSSRENRARRP
jgi:Spy/CpxP family protein refolding chaperone